MSLLIYIKQGNLPEIKKLVENGADIRADNDWAIQLASQNGHLEVVEYFVSLGADIHADDDMSVQLASMNGHLNLVRYLVSLGADIRADDDSAVQMASGSGYLEVVKYLVSLGADIYAVNNLAIRSALANGHLEVVKYILSLSGDEKRCEILKPIIDQINIDLKKCQTMKRQGITVRCYAKEDFFKIYDMILKKGSYCHDVLSYNTDYTVIALDNGEIASYLSFKLKDDVIKIEYSCTDIDYRNKGLSTLLRLVPLRFAMLTSSKYFVSYAVAEESAGLLKAKFGMAIVKRAKQFPEFLQKWRKRNSERINAYLPIDNDIIEMLWNKNIC